ncbi:hypothetical protein [Microvirga sp. TS319]|uniref:hypothetical protein n=1 Tax=Microvirga sp. TS319 TaxID=3241165 RepID=UPI00351A5A6F
MKASFRWCSGSPEFKLSGVPKGTAKIAMRMTDLDVPGYNHGGGEVAITPKQTVIDCGALFGQGTYNGPSPPSGQQHTYRWTLKALDAAGSVLGETTAERKFPEL